eukprot:9448774-Alexandrium_andersonii.AAC.1
MPSVLVYMCTFSDDARASADVVMYPLLCRRANLSTRGALASPRRMLGFCRDVARPILRSCVR